MEGAVRLFAGEFEKALHTVPDGNDRNAAWVVTPSGAYCRQVFLVGALTEVHQSGDMMYGRLADPTGGFDLSCGGSSQPVAEALRKIPLPSFISVTGQARLYTKGDTVVRSVRPDRVRVVDRAVRDRWILRTARDTLSRLESARLALGGAAPDERLQGALARYGVTPALLDELAAIAEQAVLSVKPADSTPAPEVDVRGLIIALLTADRNPRGVEVQAIIDTLAAQGVFQDAVLAAIEALIVEDECYQPQKGSIRLL
ncbi:MAG: hypothetical protein GYA23_10225 [Methanomicrobiales archaeon]|nr:hypothetical protein [Methanomicrobiales archaeon]